MRIDQLEYFQALVSLQTIQAVSDKFYTSPQVVSKAIKQLEKELNTSLFIRTRRGLLLTEAGIDICAYVEEMLNSYQHLKHKYINATSVQIPSLTILSAKGTIPYFTRLIKQLHQPNTDKQPDLTLKVDTVQEVKKQLHQSIDYDIIATVVSETELAEFYHTAQITKKYELALANRGPLKLFINQNSPWANKEKITLKQLKNLPLIKYNLADVDFDRYLKDVHNLILRYPLQVSEIGLALELVKENQGYFFAPEYFITHMFPAAQRKHIIAIPLDIDYFQSELFFIHKRIAQNPSFQPLIALLKNDLIF